MSEALSQRHCQHMPFYHRAAVTNAYLMHELVVELKDDRDNQMIAIKCLELAFTWSSAGDADFASFWESEQRKYDPPYNF